jgi:hypothetical protein
VAEYAELLRLYAEFRPKWSQISGRLGNKSCIAGRNRWLALTKAKSAASHDPLDSHDDDSDDDVYTTDLGFDVGVGWSYR